MFPFLPAELMKLKNKIRQISNVAIYNTHRISVKCWTKILGFRDIYTTLKSANPEINITIYQPPRLVFIVLETLEAKYRLSTTKDGPQRIETPA